MLYLGLCLLFSMGQVAAACGYGRLFLRAIGLRPDGERQSIDPPFDLLFALASGLGVMALLTALLGFVPGFNKPVLAAVPIAGWGALAWTLAKPLGGGEWRRELALLRPRRSLALLACLPPVAVLFLECLLPDYTGDAYLYHLSAPLFYLMEGGFARQDYAFYYHYPLLMEMLAIPALAFGLEQAAVFLNFWITLASALAIFQLGTRLHGRTAGWIAVFIYLYTPLIILWSPTTQPETGGTLFLLAALAAAWLWRRERRPSHAAQAGFFVGALTGAKLLYAWFAIGFACVFFLAAAWDLIAIRFLAPKDRLRVSHGRAGGMRSFVDATIFCAVVGLTYAPWLVKNAIFTGDPLYPLALDWFHVTPWLRRTALGYYHMHAMPTWQGVGDWVSGALRGFQQLLGGGDAGFVIGMLLVPAAWALAFVERKDRCLWTLLVAIWLVTCHYGGILQTRWFIPAYAALGLASGRVAAPLWQLPSPLPRRLATLGLAALLGINWLGGYKDRLEGQLSAGYHRPWTVLIPAQREAFLDTLPHVRTGRLVDRAVPPDGRVLVFQFPPYPQVRWYHRRFIQNGQDWFNEMVERGLTDDQIATALHQAGVTHLCTLPPGEDQRLAAFLAAHARRVTSERGYEIYALEPQPEKRTHSNPDVAS